METAMLPLLLLILVGGDHLLLVVESAVLSCESCYNPNGQVCTTTNACQGNYCLFAMTRTPSGCTLKKSCLDYPYYVDGGGGLVDQVNQCFYRPLASGGGSYVKMCNSSDYCNAGCDLLNGNGDQPPAAQPSCFQCVSYDGTECSGTQSCQGPFCLYMQVSNGSSVIIKKSCTAASFVQFDDGSYYQPTQGLCNSRLSARGTGYSVKLCATDFCNDQCPPTPYSPYGGGSGQPQQNPLVTCLNCATSYGDCFTGSCQGAFCVIAVTGGVSVKKSCSSLPYADFPDGTATSQLNQCQTQGNVQLKVCNTDYCNTNCDGTSSPGSVSPAPMIWCRNCFGSSDKSCSSQQTSCQGTYCIYEQNNQDGVLQVKKSCTYQNLIAFPDGSTTSQLNACVKRSIGDATYYVRLCNSAYCNDQCDGGSTSDGGGGAFFSLSLAVLLAMCLFFRET